MFTAIIKAPGWSSWPTGDGD